MSDGMSMGDEPRQVAITATATGAKVVVDGVDMSKSLAGYDIQHRATHAPVVVLYPKAPNAMFDGLATVVVAEQAPPGEAIAAFLSGIDPAALDAATLDRDLDGSSNELTRAMLQQLTEWARGEGI